MENSDEVKPADVPRRRVLGDRASRSRAFQDRARKAKCINERVGLVFPVAKIHHRLYNKGRGYSVGVGHAGRSTAHAKWHTKRCSERKHGQGQAKTWQWKTKTLCTLHPGRYRYVLGDPEDLTSPSVHTAHSHEAVDTGSTGVFGGGAGVPGGRGA